MLWHWNSWRILAVSVPAVTLPPQLCVLVCGNILAVDMGNDHTNSTTVITYSFAASRFPTKNAVDLTVSRLSKRKAAKVDIFSYCSIPLHHYTYPILSNLSGPLVKLRDKFYTAKCRTSTEGGH